MQTQYTFEVSFAGVLAYATIFSGEAEGMAQSVEYRVATLRDQGPPVASQMQ